MLFVLGILEGVLSLCRNWRPPEVLGTGGGVVAKVGRADVGVVGVISVGREAGQRGEGEGSSEGCGWEERRHQWPGVHMVA